MERLTKRLSSGAADYNYSKNCYFDDGSGPDRIAQSAFRQRCVERLAECEDIGLTPELVQETAEFAMWVHKNGLDKIKEWVKTDKDGHVVVLPCKPDGSMLDTSDPERPEIMKRIHFAVAYVCGGIVFHQPYNMFLENVAAGYIRPLNEEAEKALEAMKNE